MVAPFAPSPSLCGLVLAAAAFACSPEHAPSPSSTERFERAVLTRAAKNPMALAVAPSGDVYFIERTGEVRRYDAARGTVTDALVLAVDTAHENGLLGIALAPDFRDDPFVYLYYSTPLADPLPEGVPPGRNVLARFRARPDGSLDAASVEELLVVPSERRCCHEGGSLAFLPDGTLLVSTGDNTDPFEAAGAAPLDARLGRERFDARRTSANPFDLRGKILRVAADGAIPDGNRFPRSGLLGRPEIYAMGVRNPFRLAVDPATGRLFVGDIGPDAHEDAPRGPRGYDELDVADGPSDFGWPTCIGRNLAYSEVDFATGAVGAAFDCSGKTPAALAYDYQTEAFAALGTGFSPAGDFLGRAVVAGAVYRAPARAERAFPGRFEGLLVLADWTRDRITGVTVDDAGALVSVERLFATETFHRPIDADVGPDGALYLLEYGSGYWGDNADAALSRIEIATSGALAPSASIAASTTYGAAPLVVSLSAAASRAAGDGERITDYLWDFDADGDPDATGETVERRFSVPGSFAVALTVVSSSGRRSLPVSETIVVGNAPPTVRIVEPGPGARVRDGERLVLRGAASDPEDGPAPCDELVWSVSLGHNAHAHPATTLRGCEVSTLVEAGEHTLSPVELLFLAVELTYTDHGGPNDEAPLTVRQGIRVDIAY